MISKLKFFLLLTIFIPIKEASAQTPIFKAIRNYEMYYASAKRNTENWLAIRRFEDSGKTWLLLVQPRTLTTKVEEANLYQLETTTLAEARKTFVNTAYTNALLAAEKQSATIQDAGIVQGMPKEAGISLTIDLCPSHKVLDRRIFTNVFQEFSKVEPHPPVAISVSGLWMKDHQADLNWLKQQYLNGHIFITWINHTYNHRVDPKKPLKENFLLEPGTDINYEVLETEQAMLQNGLLPSVFFRFPGLVSDAKLLYEITGFGLIPIGSDAWLAKGQRALPGSIVLIHGNGNEPIGVNDFISLLKSEQKNVVQKQWLLYDLRESLDEEYH
ncbi:MAG: polysaccharide deacetylase family protein [Janthinobacterium lividum]